MTQAPTSDPQALSRMQDLLRVFEQMRERPRRRGDERLRPLLLLTGPAKATRLVTQVLARRCGDHDPAADGARRKRFDPFARVNADVPRTEEVGALLRRISQELAEHSHPWEPALRFPLLSMALWLQELGNDDAHEAWRKQLRRPGGDHRRAMRKLIRRRRPVVVPGDQPGDVTADRKDKVATLFTHIEAIGAIGTAAVTLISTVAASLLGVAAALAVFAVGLVLVAGQAVSRTRDWAGRRRYEWFTEQRYLEGGTSSDFLSFAIKTVAEEHDAHEVERLLAAAFLEDLRKAYRRRWWRRASRARVRYPVLLLDDVAEGTEGYRLIGFIEEIRAELAGGGPHGAAPAKHQRIDPLVVVAALESTTVTEDFDRLLRGDTARAEIVGVHGVQQEWQRHRADQERVSALGPRRAVRVKIADDDATMAGSADRFVDPPRSRPKAAHPALPWLSMVAVLAGSVAVIGAQVMRYCDPYAVWHADNDECIGITDGSYVFNSRLAAVQGRIHQLNEDVLSSGRPYVTMVYLGPMSVDPATKTFQPDLLAGIHGELVGLSIAQQRHNEADGQPRLRILLANVGDKFRYAREVAEKIRERVASDQTLVAAVGFGLSKRQTLAAINELGRVALPMIGTTITFDDAARLPDGTFSPYFFRLAPPDQRLADHAAYWAKNGLLGSVRARTAAVFYDTSPDDLYSRDLAEDFRESFGRDQVSMLPYQDSSEVPQKVLEACRDPADLFYYAGRSDEFEPFIQKLSTTSCGGRRIVLAGDDAAVYVTDNAVEIGKADGLRLYYTPLAAREAWQGNQPVPPFYPSYDTVVTTLTSDAAVRPSRTHAAIGHDAALVVTSVAQQIYSAQRRSLPTAGAVLAALTEPTAKASAPQGASGLLRFGPRDAGHAIIDKPVLLAGVRTDGRLRVEAVCGQLTASESPEPSRCPPVR